MLKSQIREAVFVNMDVTVSHCIWYIEHLRSSFFIDKEIPGAFRKSLGLGIWSENTHTHAEIKTEKGTMFQKLHDSCEKTGTSPGAESKTGARYMYVGGSWWSHCTYMCVRTQQSFDVRIQQGWWCDLYRCFPCQILLATCLWSAQ